MAVVMTAVEAAAIVRAAATDMRDVAERHAYSDDLLYAVNGEIAEAFENLAARFEKLAEPGNQS